MVEVGDGCGTTHTGWWRMVVGATSHVLNGEDGGGCATTDTEIMVDDGGGCDTTT